MVIEMKEIAEYILQKLGDRVYDKTFMVSVITINGEVYGLSEYDDLIDDGYDIPPAYIFILNRWFSYDPRWYHLLYYYPFMNSDLLADIYLRKYHYYRNHFGKLKYMTIITHFLSLNQTVMEVVDVDVVENNINLKELLQVLNKNDDDDDEGERIKEFRERLESQGLFDGYSFNKAIKIIKKYHRK